MPTKKVAKKITKLVIDRKRWLTGRDETDSYLRDPDTGKMCCLGFLARVCGASTRQINGKTSPATASRILWPKGLAPKAASSDSCDHDDPALNTQECQALMTANDDKGCTDQAREDEIVTGFALIGIKVSFVGEY